jgi:hypothetical protein
VADRFRRVLALTALALAAAGDGLHLAAWALYEAPTEVFDAQIDMFAGEEPHG